MSEIVKTCDIHGTLTIKEVARNGKYYKCKICIVESTFSRPCKIHGELSIDDRMGDGRCRACGWERMQALNEKRNSNRSEFNEKMKLKKEANPEWWKQVKKQEYDRLVEKEGLDSINERNKAAKFNLTINEFRKMFEEQKNLCAICLQPETRIFNGRGANAGKMKIAKLCVDHCHASGKVRGLLCHDCNTAIGKMKDDVQRLQKAIDYLNKHNEAE